MCVAPRLWQCRAQDWDHLSGEAAHGLADNRKQHCLMRQLSSGCYGCMLLVTSHAECATIKCMILAACLAKPESEDGVVLGFLSWKQLKATPTAEQGLAQRTSQACLGAASCPTAFIVSGLGTRITDASTEPTVALQTAFSNGPPTAGVHRLCGHLHVCVHAQALCTKQWS